MFYIVSTYNGSTQDTFLSLDEAKAFIDKLRSDHKNAYRGKKWNLRPHTYGNPVLIEAKQLDY